MSLLDEFFTAQVAGGFTCADMTLLFDVADPANGGTRLNTIFGQLPSYTNPDFLGMDTSLNGLKGALWNPGLSGIPKAPNNANGAKQAIANLAVIMSMANNLKISGLFSATNARIYQAFQGIDNIITTSCGTMKDHNNRPFSATWASAYSTWMTDKIASQNNLITATAASLLAAIPTVNVQGGNQFPAKIIAQQSLFVSNFDAAFPANALTFPQPSVWPNNPLPIQKRQACALSQSLTEIAASTTDAARERTSATSNVVGTSHPTITPGPMVTSTFGTSIGFSAINSPSPSAAIITSSISPLPYAVTS